MKQIILNKNIVSKNIKKKSIWQKLFVLLSAGLFLTACTTDTTNETSSPAPESETVLTTEPADAEEVTTTIHIAIDGEQLTDLTKEVTIPAGTNLMAVMKANYQVIDEDGLFSSIESHEQNLKDNRYWIYYVNDEMASVGSAKYQLEEGDVIEWRLEDSDL